MSDDPITTPDQLAVDLGGDVAPVVELDPAIRLADGITADRATGYAVYDTRLGRFVSPVLLDPDDGVEWKATKSGRFQLRRV